MTTRRSYSCNLCCDNVSDGVGIGIRWASDRKIELTVPSGAESHICQKCITALEEALEDQREMQRKRAEIDTHSPGAFQ